MDIIQSISSVRQMVDHARRSKCRVVLVPTMGYFHEGHLELMRVARRLADEGAASHGLVIVSNFVNPTQFGPNEDYARYPRDLDRDATMAGEVGVDAMFCPSVSEMYPREGMFQIDVGPMGKVLCGTDRPTHFNGVATVVLKLFNIVAPDHAIFGWKDAQQLLILKRLARDFDLTLRLHGVETWREADGLAMSSRNVFLTDAERASAPMLQRELRRLMAAVVEDATPLADAIAQLRSAIGAEPLASLVYVEARRMSDLTLIDTYEPGNTLVALACRFSRTRLIDNIRF